MKELLTKISEELVELFTDYEEFEESYTIIPLSISDVEVEKIKGKNIWIGFHLVNYDKRSLYNFLTNTDIGLLMQEAEDSYRRKFLYGVVVSTMRLFDKFERKYDYRLDDVFIVAEIFETKVVVLKTMGKIEILNIRSIWSFI